MKKEKENKDFARRFVYLLYSQKSRGLRKKDCLGYSSDFKSVGQIIGEELSDLEIIKNEKKNGV